MRVVLSTRVVQEAHIEVVYSELGLLRNSSPPKVRLALLLLL